MPSLTKRSNRQTGWLKARLVRQLLLSVSLASLLGGLAACGKRADLLALDGGPDMASVCRLDDKGRLVVTIRNQGRRISKATTTQIVFGSLPAIRLPTRPVAARDSVSVVFPIPEECFHPECQFQITVDAKNEVEETDEGNNLVQGLCTPHD